MYRSVALYSVYVLQFDASAESIAALTRKPTEKPSKPPIAPSSSSSSLAGKKNKRRKNTDRENDKPSPVRLLSTVQPWVALGEVVVCLCLL
jgi:hypothetical protein